MIRLSKRLTALANMVTPGNRLADIGTDHGYIPIYLVEAGKIPAAVAMDVKEGPLERARAHVTEQNLQEQITLRLSDGVQKLQPDEADTVLIAGMGGGLVQKILSEGTRQLENVRELILQPQSEIAQVRAYLRTHGWQIMDEDMVEEDGKYYPMMKAVRKEEEDLPEQSKQLQDCFGPILLERRHPVLYRWITREQEISKRILEQLERQEHKEKIKARRLQIQEKLELLSEAQKLFGRDTDA